MADALLIYIGVSGAIFYTFCLVIVLFYLLQKIVSLDMRCEYLEKALRNLGAPIPDEGFSVLTEEGLLKELSKDGNSNDQKEKQDGLSSSGLDVLTRLASGSASSGLSPPEVGRSSSPPRMQISNLKGPSLSRMDSGPTTLSPTAAAPKYAKPRYLVFMRHGESEANKDARAYQTVGDPNVRLTEKGINDATKAGRKLGKEITEKLGGNKKIFVYVSPYMRTRETAAYAIESLREEGHIICKTDEDPRIREREFAGTFQTDQLDMNTKNFDRFFWRPNNGESCADVYDRITLFLSTLWRDFLYDSEMEDEVVLVVTHGITMRILIMRWLHWTRETFVSTYNPDNGDYVVLELDDRSSERTTCNHNNNKSDDNTSCNSNNNSDNNTTRNISSSGRRSYYRSNKRYHLTNESKIILFGSLKRANDCMVDSPSGHTGLRDGKISVFIEKLKGIGKESEEDGSSILLSRDAFMGNAYGKFKSDSDSKNKNSDSKSHVDILGDTLEDGDEIDENTGIRKRKYR